MMIVAGLIEFGPNIWDVPPRQISVCISLISNISSEWVCMTSPLLSYSGQVLLESHLYRHFILAVGLLLLRDDQHLNVVDHCIVKCRIDVGQTCSEGLTCATWYWIMQTPWVCNIGNDSINTISTRNYKRYCELPCAVMTTCAPQF